MSPTEPERVTAAGNETARQLLEDLRHHLPQGVTPEDAIQAVMCTFSLHVPGAQAREVFESLPRLIQPLLERCMIHRDQRSESFGPDQLIVRVAEHLSLSLEDAERVTKYVLTAIASRLPAKAVGDVAAELPLDLREFWPAHHLAVAAPVVPHPILSRIERSVGLPQGVTGEGAFESVMRHLSRRLTLADATSVFENLPTDLRELVESALFGRDEAAEPFGRTEFLERVALDLKMPGNVLGAEQVALEVFRNVEDYMPASVFEHVMNELPSGLSDLWAVLQR